MLKHIPVFIASVWCALCLSTPGMASQSASASMPLAKVSEGIPAPGVPSYAENVTAANTPDLEPITEGDVTYLTGGIGDEDRRAMEAVRSEYNLHLMSAGLKGEFAGVTTFTIADSTGKELVHIDAGPLTYVKLPPGKYTVRGESGGQARQQSVTIGERKGAHIHFSWK